MFENFRYLQNFNPYFFLNLSTTQTRCLAMFPLGLKSAEKPKIITLYQPFYEKF